MTTHPSSAHVAPRLLVLSKEPSRGEGEAGLLSRLAGLGVEGLRDNRTCQVCLGGISFTRHNVRIGLANLTSKKFELV